MKRIAIMAVIMMMCLAACSAKKRLNRLLINNPELVNQFDDTLIVESEVIIEGDTMETTFNKLPEPMKPIRVISSKSEATFYVDSLGSGSLTLINYSDTLKSKSKVPTRKLEINRPLPGKPWIIEMAEQYWCVALLLLLFYVFGVKRDGRGRS